MELIYVLVNDCCEWEDMIVFTSEETAIKGSIKYPTRRVEVFSKKENEPTYTPTYNYYQNGNYFETS